MIMPEVWFGCELNLREKPVKILLLKLSGLLHKSCIQTSFSAVMKFEQKNQRKSRDLCV